MNHPEPESSVLTPAEDSSTVHSPPTMPAHRRWLLFVVALYPLVAVWSMTNPMFASPDETLHMIRAQAFAQLDFTDPVATDGLPVESIDCFAFLPEVPASCRTLSWGPDGTPRVTAMDGYPPLFHAVAAVPALVSSGVKGAFLMRLWLGAICVALVAWAGVLLTRPGAGRWPLAGFLLAMTPMTIFTMATVNPSGMASAGTILMVSAAVALYARTSQRRSALLALAIGATVLIFTRRDGVIWFSVLAVVLAPLVPWRALRDVWRELPRRRRAAIVAVVIAALGVGAVIARPTVTRFYSNWRDGLGGTWWEATRYLRTYLVQVVGVFGWLDSPLGEEGFLLVMMASGVLVVLGLAARRPALVTSTVLGVAMLCITPVVFSVARFPYLQGRYLLPIWAGLLLVAGAATAQSELPRRLTYRGVNVLIGAWLVAQATGVVQNLRRYAVGRNGPWGFVLDPDVWHPKAMSNLMAVCAIAVAVVVAAVAIRALLDAADENRSDLFGQTAGHTVEDAPADQEAER